MGVMECGGQVEAHGVSFVIVDVASFKVHDRGRNVHATTLPARGTHPGNNFHLGPELRHGGMGAYLSSGVAMDVTVREGRDRTTTIKVHAASGAGHAIGNT